jgi:hemimethylated DNA binding protein
VKHQKYNFRGIVTGWDAYPRTDVSRWDGLQNMKGDINNMPFYHIAADANDTMQAFGQERRFRYVCEENLEIVDHHSSVEESGDSNSGSGANYDTNYGLDLDVDLNDEWIISKQDGSTEVEYLAPDQLKFQHDESIGSKE